MSGCKKFSVLPIADIAHHGNEGTLEAASNKESRDRSEAIPIPLAYKASRVLSITRNDMIYLLSMLAISIIGKRRVSP